MIALIVVIALVLAAIALMWPASKPLPGPFTLSVHPAIKQPAEVEALTALNKVKDYLRSKGATDEELNAAIAPFLIHFTSRGD